METPDEKWFRERLRHFLEIRHPPRQFHHVMIERRSRLAFESYAQSVELGVPAASAVRAADKVLFRGLLFLTKAQPGKKATFFFFRHLRLHSSLLLHGTALTLCT